MPSLLQPLCTAASTAQAASRAGLSLLLLAALVLSACGGSSGRPPEPSTPPVTGTPPTPPAQGKGTVVIQVTTTDGAPVPGTPLAINGGFDGRGATTDAKGEARFTDVPTGDAQATTGGPPYGGGTYHPAASRFRVVADAVTTVPIVVESVTEAVPVVLAARTAPSSDGSTMILELDIAVLDEQGMARETLTAGDFSLDGGCGWYGCLINADGTDSYFYYSARVEDASLVPVSTWFRPALATAILLDQSKSMAAFDPTSLRVSGLNSFLGSITAPDRVTLGRYYDAAVSGETARPEVTTYGPFTSDTSELLMSSALLPGQETGRNTIAATSSAIAQLVQFTSSQAPGDPGGTRWSVVVVDSQLSGEQGCYPCSCRARCSEAVQAARDAGIPVVAIGMDYSYGLELASWTGGAVVPVVAPEQLEPVFRGLDSIVSGTLAYNRVRLVLESTPGGLQPGRVLWGYLFIRIGPNTEIMPWITVPIGQD